MTRRMMLAIIRRSSTTDATLRRYVSECNNDDEIMLAIARHDNVSQETLMEIYLTDCGPDVVAAIAGKVMTQQLADFIVSALEENSSMWNEDEWNQVYDEMSSNYSIRYFACMSGFYNLSYPNEDSDCDEADEWDGYFGSNDDDDDEFWQQAWDDAMEK